MADQSIQPRTEDNYYEGEPLDIPIQITDDAGATLDIRDMALRFIVKEEQTDRETILTKSGGDIEYTDPLNGEAVVYIYEGDTQGFLDQNGGRAASDTFFAAVKADSITVLTADWTIHAN